MREYVAFGLRSVIVLLIFAVPLCFWSSRRQSALVLNIVTSWPHLRQSHFTWGCLVIIVEVGQQQNESLLLQAGRV